MDLDLNKLTESHLVTEDENTLDLVSGLYIVDYGIVKSISTDKKTISVYHATKPVLYNQIDGSETIPQVGKITNGIELLYLGSSHLAFIYDVSVGDIVLLLGSKTYVDNIENITQADKPKMYSSYNQENLKALPIRKTTNVTVNITIDTNGIKIDCGLKDFIAKATNVKLGSDTASESFVKGDVFATQYNSLLTALQTFSNGLTTTTLAANATALNGTLTTLLTLINNIKSIKIKGE
jgi:hypothetical protein